jgi:hypothetical protein
MSEEELNSRYVRHDKQKMNEAMKAAGLVKRVGNRRTHLRRMQEYRLFTKIRREEQSNVKQTLLEIPFKNPKAQLQDIIETTFHKN